MPVTTNTVRDWMGRFAASMHEHREELVRLDTAIGGMVLKTVAMALVSSVGGAAGPLYGTLFLQMGTALAGKQNVDLEGYAAAWRKGVEGVQARGKAEPQDKTMLDALLPAVEALEGASELDSGLRAATEAAERGMRDTIPLIARKGRASYLGDRSRDHQDPGATSTYYLCQTAADALTT